MNNSEPIRHILWITETASFLGGCETYIAQTVTALNARGIRSTLLYNPEFPSEVDFLQLFEAAFPLLSPQRQIEYLNPDLIYIHRLQGTETVRQIASADIPTLRFFHDHRLFCLREHKYKPFSHQTCTHTLGPRCLTCPGWLARSEGWPHLKVNRLASRQQELAANRHLDHFVVGSTYMAEHVVRHGFDPTRVHRLSLFAPTPQPASPPIPRQDNLILFVGQLTRGKGVDTLLHALAQMHTSPTLAIVGTGPQKEELQTLTSSLRLDHCVTFHGFLQGEQKRLLYQQASLLAVPSRAPETFALVGPEAMSYATPVVATDVGGIEEWLFHRHNGLAIPPNDPASLASALDKLLENPLRAQQMGEAGRQLVQQRFTIHHHLDELLNLFSSITAPTPRHSQTLPLGATP